jgi:hypothetical protein
VVVTLSIDDGPWQTSPDSAAVQTSRGGSASIAWTVPDLPSRNARIRVRDVADPTLVAQSAPFAIGASQASSYRWQRITDTAAFAPRDGAGTIVSQGRMWLLGGWNQYEPDPNRYPGRTNNEIWSSSDGLDWRLELAAAPWERRHSAGSVLHRNRMWLVGGDDVGGHYQPDVWSSGDGITWQLATAAAPWGQRVLHATFAFKDKLWVLGGQTLPQFSPEVTASIFYNDVWSSSDGVAWTRSLDFAPWPARSAIIGNAVLGDRMWLIGGGTYETPDFPGFHNYNDVWNSADGVHWTQILQHAPWGVRQYQDVAVFDDRLWVLGGCLSDPSTDMRDVWYSADGVNWYEQPNTPWPARHAGNVFVHDGALWLVAGSSMTTDVWKISRSATAPVAPRAAKAPL